MANNKLVAVFLVCALVLAAVNVHEAEAAEPSFKDCFNHCVSQCSAEGRGSTMCEMRCDGECTEKAIAAKLGLYL